MTTFYGVEPQTYEDFYIQHVRGDFMDIAIKLGCYKSTRLPDVLGLQVWDTMLKGSFKEI